MSLRYRSFLDGVLVDEPINLGQLSLSLVRDDDLHGIGGEASTQTLQFIGDGADYIKNKKDTQGQKSKITILIEQNCGDDSEQWDPILEGSLNMSKYSRTCGSSCIVSVPVESTTCETVLKNRLDQAVDLDKLTSFDGITTIPGYAKMGVDISLPTRELEYKTEGYVADAGYDQPVEFGQPVSSGETIFMRPNYERVISQNILDSNLSDGTNVGIHDGDVFFPFSPQVLWNEPAPACFATAFKVNARLKGTISFPGTLVDAFTFWFERGDGDFGSGSGDLVTIQETRLFFDVHDPVDYPFDITIPEYLWNPKPTGTDGLYLFFTIDCDSDQVVNGTIHWDKETFFKAESVKACPPTSTKAYLIHETLSRAVEAVTDYCIRVKSAYYGRTDSEPFAFPSDGCGGLRFLTSGLKIRNAANPTFFASPQDLIKGLTAIDNIGMGIEPDPLRTNYLLLRIEALDYFYRDNELLRCPGVADGKEAMDNKSYSKIQVGYKKWETQANFGLDEFNSNREYRTSLTAISATLDITSTLVVGEYAIEITRQQQYVDTSEADTTYDDETFLICLKRDGANLVVEQGNVTSPTHIFSPGSVYNYRLTPVRNLMRWFRSIAAGYPNITDSDNRLFFNAGTGNILASGWLDNPFCRQERGVLAENQDVLPLIFEDQGESTPLWKNETFSFDYPMSVKEYNQIKANPYGYISYQCGNGGWEKGWIKELEFRPFDGMATITLKKTWN